MIEFEGLDDLIAEFDRIEKVTPATKDQALIRGGDILKGRMQEEVYRNGLQRRSGAAQASIVRTDPSNNELFVGTQGGKKQPGFYLYMHEFGFYNVRAKRFIAPRPFASIAYESSKSEILDAYANEFRKGYGL